jgi:hypothetical protein
VKPLQSDPSTDRPPKRGPGSSPAVNPAMIAIAFTTVLIQVQAAYQGNARDLLPILIAALLVMAGVSRSLPAKAGLTRITRKCPSFPHCGEGGHFRLRDERPPAVDGRDQAPLAQHLHGMADGAVRHAVILG